MKRKTIIMGFLLTTLFFSGCGRNVDSEENQSSQNMNNTTESSVTSDRNNISETSPMNDTNNITETADSGSFENTDGQNSSNETTSHDNTGTSQNTDHAAMLTEQEVKQIVLEKIPGATEDDFKKFKKDSDDSIIEYEGEIHYDGIEYEFEIHAYDGTVLEWDEEPIKEMVR